MILYTNNIYTTIIILIVIKTYYISILHYQHLFYFEYLRL